MNASLESKVRRLTSRAAYLKIQNDRRTRKSPTLRHWEVLGSPDNQPNPGPSSQPDASPTIASQEAANVFHYVALTSPGSLRLLKILPLMRNEYVKVEIWEAPDSASYRCLSYTWGDQSCQFPILLNGRRALVGANLLGFLKMAAQQFPGQAFWIDALCINQLDDDEKSVQVQRMGSIYENANDVLIWLGHHEGIAALFEWAGKPRSAIGKAMAHVPIEKTPRHLRSYVLDLAKHPYWRRAWVRQEMILAKTRKIACGSVTIHVDALFRCISSNILSSTVLERDEWMVHMDLEMRLRRLCRPRVQHQHFWDVFGLSGEIPNCSDPRDRIYSILAVTGQDQTFRIDYSEDIVSFFWRALHHFTPETDPGKVQRLWNSLELTPNVVEEAIEANGAPLQTFILMRRTEIKPDLRRQLPGLFRLRRAGLCGHDPFNFARAQVQGYTRHDILLCPGTSNELNEDEFYRNTIDLEGMHVLVHPLGPTEDGFTLTLLSTTYRRLPQPAGTELWSSIDGAETKIQKWSEVERVAGLSGFSNVYDDNWKSRPHFMLKLSHQYVIECVKAVQDYWDEKYRRSWTETPKADKFQDDVLMAIGLKKRKHKRNS